MLKRIPIIAFLLFGVFGKTVAQDTDPSVQLSDSVVKHMGQDHYWHQVQKGETLFAISKAYKVFLSSLVFANPGVMDGIQPGQALLIPKETVAPSDALPEPTPVDGNHIIYTVPPKMTLYSISKEYDVSIERLVEANPSLKDGLKNGMKLRIPMKGILEEAGTDHIELTGIPELIAAVERDTADPMNILLFAPFFLDENDTLVAHQKAGDPEETFPRSLVGIQFYEGLLVALDSLTRLGHRFNIKTVDTERSITKVERYVRNRALKRPDLIIGPFYKQLIKPVAKFAYNNCVPMITPTARNLESVGYNDHMIQSLPGTKTTNAEIGAFLATRNKDDNFILAHYARPEEQQLQLDFRKGFESLGTDSLPDIQVVDLEAGTYDEIKTKLSSEVPNHILVLTNNEASVSKLMRSMIGWLEDFEIILYATENWAKFKNIDVEYFDQMRLHRPDAMHVIHEDSTVISFNSKFRESFGTEPSTFALRGYDIGMKVIPLLKEELENGIYALAQGSESKGLQQSFQWRQNALGHWVNSRSFILRLNDLRLEPAD